MKNYLDNPQAGFTLIEIMVAVTVFMVIMTMSLNAMLAVSAQNKKAQHIRSITDNINFALDTIVRDMRLGSDYDCGIPDTEKNCVTVPFSMISFKDKEGATVMYARDGSTQSITRKVGTAAAYALTSDDVQIDRLNFYVTGVGVGDFIQPQAVIELSASIAEPRGNPLKFDVQTYVTQRQVESGLE